MTLIDDFPADPSNRFATVAMAATNGLLRGQMVSAQSLKSIVMPGMGMGMAPAQLSLNPTDVLLSLPGVRQGKSVTFMPRWSEQADSRSIHLHVSLKDKAGKPLFRDQGRKNGVTRNFHHFLGGLQAYIGDMTLILQPTVNSYHRFAPGTFAPPGLTWAHENRTTCFRLVAHDAGSLRVENRLTGSDTNPCLTTAATLAAGLAGILNRIEPEPVVTGSGYAQEPTRDFARSIPEAIKPLRASEFARDWLGGRFVDGFTATREAQDEEFRRKVPDVGLHRLIDLG